MVKNIYIFIFAMFVIQFFACGSDNPPPETEIPGGTGMYDPKAWDDKDGFFQHKDHKYGFDLHPTPTKDEDYTAYASVLNGDKVVFNLKMNKEKGHDFFICNPDNNSMIAEIDESQISESHELRYEYFPRTDNDKIALCRKGNVGTEKMHDLQIQQYNWKEYEFDVYSLGDMNTNDDRHPFNNNFWIRFDSIFSQAVVRPGMDFGESWNYKRTLKYDRGYILTRTAGDYIEDDKDVCTKGDISRAIDTMIMHVKVNLISYENYGERKRAVIQTGGYKTKRFWPIKYEGGKIQICGKPNKTPPNFLVVETVCSPLPLVDKLYASKEGEEW
jgi:hypothetical protein